MALKFKQQQTGKGKEIEISVLEYVNLIFKSSNIVDNFIKTQLFQGYLVNWDVQRQVWDYLFGKEMYQVTKWSMYSNFYFYV